MSGRWVQLVAGVTAAACLFGSLLLVGPINRQRVDLGVVQVSRYGDAPKYVLLAAAMGTFRGLAADFLWYRAEQLKNEGKLFEANTLAEWITNLQPRFGQVWVFQSWNMAYNISVITHTPEERWDWVNKGIKLLRDEGIVYNPNNIAIYRQLAWTFFHKIGQRADDMNTYYKAKLAMEWQEILGNPTEGATKELALERFKPIRDAAVDYFSVEADVAKPRDPLTRLYEKHPSTRLLVAKLREIGYEPDEQCLRTIGRIGMFQRYGDPRQLVGPDGPLLDEKGNKLYDLLMDPAYTEGFTHLIPFMQARVLIETYHMEPTRMYALMERFGPMDWRHAGSHAIYWAATGIEKAGELKDKTKIDVLNTDRQIIQGLQMLMHSGTLSFDPLTMRIDTTPDPRFIDAYGDAMVEANERQKSTEWAGKGNEKSFEQGHENFLLRAVLYSYLYGDLEQAHRYYKQLRELYGDKPHNQYPRPRYNMPLEDLIADEIKNDWQMTDQVARPMIESLMVKAFREGLARADYRTYGRFIETAKRIEKELREDRQYDNPISPMGQGRLIDWKNFESLLGDTYVKYLRSPNYDLFERAQVYRNSPTNFRQVAYPRVIEAVKEQARLIGYEDVVDRLFPPPPKPDAPPVVAPPGEAPDESKEPSGQKTLERK
ncbi:MAG: hypothetical protein Kow00105_19770 [Phycisphaeraceae bacterium]